MHQIRQKNQNPAKEMQPDRRSRRRSTIAPTSGARPTSALVRRAPTSDARPTSALVDRVARSHRSRRASDDRAARSRRSRRSSAQCDRRRSGAIWALSSLSLSLSLSLIWALSSLSLSLSLSFLKLFEVKMRGETEFRVKGEKIGQPKVIFRKMIFSVTAKHTENGENDFLKSFSPKTNVP